MHVYLHCIWFYMNNLIKNKSIVTYHVKTLFKIRIKKFIWQAAVSNLSPRRLIKCRYKYLTSMQFNKDNTCMWIYYLFYENCFLWMDGRVKCRHIAWSFLRVHRGRGRQETTFSCSKHVYVWERGGCTNQFFNLQYHFKLPQKYGTAPSKFIFYV